MSYSFTAAPQIVRGKTKYRPEGEETEGKTPWELEQDYVKREEDRIKIENMQRQLLNFKKSNKNKKMSPFDIKPTPNPRIPINLSFFLTDQNTTKPKLKNVVAQTDQFNNKITKGTASDAEFIPKKTGIDAFTQVENDELFNFDREVEPIIDVIISKTLEQSLLEIEEEEEIEKMRLFKRDYVRRKVKKNDDDWKEIIEAEMDKIDEKERQLAELSYSQIQKEALSFKLISHKMACNYLSNLQENSVNSLYIKGLYQHDEEINSMNDYWEWMLDQVIDELNTDLKIETEVKKIFPDTVPTLRKMREPKDKRNVKDQSKVKRVEEYKQNPIKDFWFYWINEVENCPLYYSVFHGMILDNTIETYDADMIAKYDEQQSRYDGGQLSAEEYTETQKTEFPDLGKSVFRMGLNKNSKQAFGMANNAYWKLLKSDRIFDTGCLAIDAKGEIQGHSTMGENSNCLDKIIRTRYAPFFDDQKFNDEQIIKIDLEKALQYNIKYFYFYLWGDDIDARIPQMQEMIDKTHYHVFDYKTNVNYHRTSSMVKINDALMSYVPENRERGEDDVEPPKNNCWVGTYLIHYDGKNWNLETQKAYAVMPEDKTTFQTRVAKSLPKYNFKGDQGSTIEAWGRMSEQIKKDALLEEQKEADRIRGRGRNVDASDDDEEVIEKDKPKDKNANADGDDKLDDKKVIAEKDHNNRLIGPLRIDTNTMTVEQILEGVACFIKDEEPELNEYFTAGFDVSVKYKLFESVMMLININDWRQIVIRKKEPIPEPDAEALDGSQVEGDGEDGDKDQGDD